MKQHEQASNKKNDQNLIDWREFCLICASMYRQVIPGLLIMSGILVAIMIWMAYLAG